MASLNRTDHGDTRHPRCTSSLPLPDIVRRMAANAAYAGAGVSNGSSSPLAEELSPSLSILVFGEGARHVIGTASVGHDGEEESILPAHLSVSRMETDAATGNVFMYVDDSGV